MTYSKWVWRLELMTYCQSIEFNDLSWWFMVSEFDDLYKCNLIVTFVFMTYGQWVQWLKLMTYDQWAWWPGSCPHD